MKKKTIIKTNYIPAIIMLLAGFLYCIIGIKNKVEVVDFCVQLLIVLLVFYILGGIIKLVLDILMEKTAASIQQDEIDNLFEEESTEDLFAEKEEKENIHTE